MSRHPVQGFDPALELVLGWDQGLSTYFAQVADPRTPPEEDHILFWIGVAPGAIPTVALLADLMQEYVTLSPEIQAQLQRDKDQAPPLTGLQTTMQGFLAAWEALVPWRQEGETDAEPQ
jgi:hypothetical protein